MNGFSFDGVAVSVTGGASNLHKTGATVGGALSCPIALVDETHSAQ